MGEAGAEIPARASHTLNILQLPVLNEGAEGEKSRAYLVVYGGASPEAGPLDDCYYAVLPEVSAIEPESFHLHWYKVESGTTSNNPMGREMHAAVTLPTGLCILGGRDLRGNLLRDCWVLQEQHQSTGPDGSITLAWQVMDDLALPEGMCAHTACCLSLETQSESESTATSSPVYLLVCGGLRGQRISTTSLVRRLLFDNAGKVQSKTEWTEHKIECPARFGHAACAIRADGIRALRAHPLYGPLLQRGLGGKAREAALLLFGGVNEQQDLADLQLILLHQ